MLGEPDKSIGRTSLSEVLSMDFLIGFTTSFNFQQIFSVSSLIQKLRKSSCLGSQDNPSPLAFTEGLIFYKYSSMKEGFLNQCVVSIK